MFLRINIIANTIIETGMSGGNRIFIENAKRWAKKGVKIRIFTSNVGEKICIDSGLTNAEFIVRKLLYRKEKFSKFELVLLYLLALIKGLENLAVVNPKKNEIIYSSSDYWPDSIPAIISKIFIPKIIWIAGFFLFSPKPWQKNSPYKGKRWFIGLFYWLTQLPVYWFIKKYADMVFITSEPDVEKFVTKRRSRDKIVVIRGGVDIKPSEEYLKSENVIPVEKRKYDACFVGRFHPQKGVLELIDIWKLVCEKKPDAKLGMIGVGSLENEVKEKIKKYNLEDNIDLLGFKDGQDKYEIFKQSKMILHPATYDSGGMASAEGMAWGLPGVSFDLEALKTYYSKGMIKTKCFDLKEFSENILKLLNDKELYNKYSREAHNFIVEVWDWNKRAKIIFNKIQELYD